MNNEFTIDQKWKEKALNRMFSGSGLPISEDWTIKVGEIKIPIKVKVEGTSIVSDSLPLKIIHLNWKPKKYEAAYYAGDYRVSYYDNEDPSNSRFTKGSTVTIHLPREIVKVV